MLHIIISAQSLHHLIHSTSPDIYYNGQSHPGRACAFSFTQPLQSSTLEWSESFRQSLCHLIHSTSQELYSREVRAIPKEPAPSQPLQSLEWSQPALFVSTLISLTNVLPNIATTYIQHISNLHPGIMERLCQGMIIEIKALTILMIF